MICNKCGRVIMQGDLFCSNCGTKINNVEQFRQDNSQINNNMSYQNTQVPKVKIKFPIFRILLPFLLYFLLNVLKFIISITMDKDIAFFGIIGLISLLIFVPNIFIQILLWDNKKKKAIDG